VVGGSVFSVIHCGSFYGKYNKLPVDEDAIRRELEHSGNDEEYLSDLDEEFCDLSSEEDNGVNQVSRAEPSYKKARISVRTLSVDLEDSEEEIGVERTERHVIKSDCDSETNIAVGGGSGCAGGDGNGEQKVMVLIVNMMMRIWMSVVLVILLYKEKQPHKQGIATKM
jgi:hypothetical protein